MQTPIQAQTVAIAKHDIAHRLRMLANEMESIGVMIDYYGGLKDWARWGRELFVAAEQARSLSDYIERDPA